MYEILHGHPICCYEMFHMEKHTFHKLCTNLTNHGLTSTNHMSVKEMITMFLNMFGYGIYDALRENSTLWRDNKYAFS